MVRNSQTLRAYSVRRHTLGKPAGDDVEIFEETDDTFDVRVTRTRDQQDLIIGCQSTLATESRVIKTTTPHEPPITFLSREACHEYSVGHANGRFFVRTNWQAPNFRLMSMPLASSQDKNSWKEELPANATTFLHDFDLFAEYLIVTERKNTFKGIRVLPWSDPGSAYDIDFGQPISVTEVGQNPEFDTHTLRCAFQSMITPESIYDYHKGTREQVLLKQDDVLGDFSPDNYLSQRIFATATDGTKVPISLVFRKDLDRTIPQPTYQYGYGSYGSSMEPGFSAERLSLLDRGFIYAIAHIRGGQEHGRHWYEDGKLNRKINTFTDFIDCSKHLIEAGYTSPKLLVAAGGSAGSLLVGAVANMAPQQYRLIAAEVPFVDIVSTMLDETIPLTTNEYDEWGNPHNRDDYNYMLSYSPYDQVTAQHYPHILIMTGLHDSQVQYWEPAKWAAKLRANSTGNNLILLHTNMDTGHGGASGRFRKYRDLALKYTLVLDTITQPN